MCTVKELIERLQELPPEMEVKILEVNLLEWQSGSSYQWIGLDVEDTDQFSIESHEGKPALHLGVG